MNVTEEFRRQAATRSLAPIEVPGKRTLSIDEVRALTKLDEDLGTGLLDEQVYRLSPYAKSEFVVGIEVLPQSLELTEQLKHRALEHGLVCKSVVAMPVLQLLEDLTELSTVTGSKGFNRNIPFHMAKLDRIMSQVPEKDKGRIQACVYLYPVRESGKRRRPPSPMPLQASGIEQLLAFVIATAPVTWAEEDKEAVVRQIARLNPGLAREYITLLSKLKALNLKVSEMRLVNDTLPEPASGTRSAWVDTTYIKSGVVDLAAKARLALDSVTETELELATYDDEEWSGRVPGSNDKGETPVYIQLDDCVYTVPDVERLASWICIASSQTESLRSSAASLKDSPENVRQATLLVSREVLESVNNAQ